VSAAHRFALRCARDDGNESARLRCARDDAELVSLSFIRLRIAPIASVAHQYKSAGKVSDKSGDKLGDKSDRNAQVLDSTG
jgi:hypothetical protein